MPALVTPRAAALSLCPCPPPWQCPEVPGVPRGAGVPAHMDVQLHVLPLAEPRELVTAMKHREGKSGAPGENLPAPPPPAPAPSPISEQKDPWDLFGDRQHPPGPLSGNGETLGREESPESLLRGQTPLELLSKGPLAPLWAGRPWSPVGWDTPICVELSPLLPLDEFLEDAPTQVLADLLNVGLGVHRAQHWVPSATPRSPLPLRSRHHMRSPPTPGISHIATATLPLARLLGLLLPPRVT